MKRNNPDLITLNINIPEDIYRRVLDVIKTHELLEETGAIQKIISVGLLKLKIDTIKEEKTSLSSQTENLRKETKRLIEEISKFEKLCSESRKDNDYIRKRLEKFNSENEELEAFIRPTKLSRSGRRLDDKV
jgi:septal ring factor EnvC (AmiA/AmiB activator)